MRDLFSIGNVSKMFDVSIKTLHHYDKIGLLKPSYIDKETRYRYYSSSQFLHLYIIKELKHQGFTLNDIQSFLKNDDLHYVYDLYRNKENDIENEIYELSRLKKRISVKVNQLEKIFDYVEREKKLNDKNELFPIEIKRLSKRTIISIRRKTPFNFFAVALRTIELFNLLEKNNLQMIDPYIIIFHDEYDNLMQFNIDYEIYACIEEESLSDAEIPIDLKKTDFIKVLEEGDFAVTRSRGNYDESLPVYNQMINWIDNNGYEKCGPAHKYYVANFSLTKNIENMIYELYIPIKKKNN